VAGVARTVADTLGVPAPPDGPDTAEPVSVEPGWCDVRLPGQLYELLAPTVDRRRRGAWFTPPPVVDALVALALDQAPVPGRVLDPACGAGAFLLGAADALVAAGIEPADALARVTGVDLDPGAVSVARWSLDLWAAGHGVAAGSGRLLVGDGLTAEVDPPDLVVGNPPFGSPLRAARAASPAVRYRAARPHLGPYADDAACFLDRAADLVAPGGRLVLVLPQSLLAGRDTAGLRERLGDGWRLRSLWACAEPVFDAAVHVFAPVLEPVPANGGPTTVALFAGADVHPAGRSPTTDWAGAAATALGVPPVGLDDAGVLADLAGATSGFRDEHYALVAAAVEAADAPAGDPVITVGQIDPLRWRRDQPVRFGARRWVRPVVSSHELPPRTAAWVARQQRPKVLLATQSRVLEPLIDRSGRLVPSTPVIAVHAEPALLSRVAAVLLAPPVVAWAARHGVGTALGPHAIKLAARQVLELPLPAHTTTWAEAATLLDGIDEDHDAPPELLWEVATRMCRAYGQPVEPLRSWWWARLPSRGDDGRNGPDPDPPVESAHGER
jgi:predicted RNA methylase